MKNTIHSKALPVWLIVAFVCVLAPHVQASPAGTWIRYDMPSDILNNYEIIWNCDVDSKGTVWYTSVNGGKGTGGGLYSQSPDDSSWMHYDVPENPDILRMGVYVDPSTDSVYVGGVEGAVYSGKDGVFHALPSIPLLYDYIDMYDDTTAYTHVTGFARGKGGRLVASTDSMAWWLDTAKQQWEPIGLALDYELHGWAKLNAIALDPTDSSLWVAGNGRLAHINTDWTVDAMGEGGAYGLTVGPSGTIYAGTSSQYLDVHRPPDYASDSIVLEQSGEYFTEHASGAPYEDANGWLWAAQTGGRIMVLHGDSVKYIFTDGLDELKWLNRAVVGPDSSFWICTEYEVLRYSEKYSIPDEATSVLAHGEASLGGAIEPVSGGVQLITGSGQWRAGVYSPQGRLMWSGAVSGNQFVSLEPGAWVVRLRGPDGHSIQRTIGIVR